MARLPQPGGDAGNWGAILNDYLSMSHKEDGVLKDGIITSTQLDSSINASMSRASTAIQPDELAVKYTLPSDGIPLSDIHKADLDEEYKNITFKPQYNITMSMFVNPSNRYRIEHAGGSTRWAVRIDTDEAAGSMYGVALSDVNLSEIVYDYTLTSRDWIVIGADDNSRAYIINGLHNGLILRIDGSSNLASRGNTIAASGANIANKPVKVIFGATTISVYEEVNAAWVLWTTIDKTAVGITRNRGGVINGSSNSGSQDMQVDILSATTEDPTLMPAGHSLDVTSIGQSAFNQNTDGFLLYSTNTESGIKKTDLSTLSALLGYTNDWFGKNIYLYGDSLSSTDYTWYASQLSEKTGANVTAGGRSGSTAAQQTNIAWLDSIVASSPDVVIYLTGGNDQGVAGTVGTFEDSPGESVVAEPDVSAIYQGSTYVESIAYVVKYLNSKMYNFKIGNSPPYTSTRKPKIILLNGLPQRRNNSTLTEAWNDPANHLRKVNAVREVADRYHVPLLDIFKLCGWDSSQEPYWTSPTNMTADNGVYTMDGLHPNSFGYDRLTTAIASFIKSI